MSEVYILEKFGLLSKLKQEFINNIKISYAFDDNESKSNLFVVTNDDKVYAYGENSYGVLGFGHKNRVKVLTKVDKLCNKGIIQFKNGLQHVIAITIDGKVFSWGFNKWGVLGDGKQNPKISKPKLNKYLNEKQIIQISCGFWHTIALTIDGEVYGWGNNNWGQTGSELFDNHSKCQKIPTLVTGLDVIQVKDIACGYSHSMALTETGHVFSWGSNEFGQLGTGSRDNSFHPQLIHMNGIAIEKISCGYDHSLLLSIHKDLYVFGCNQCSELGIKCKENCQSAPKLLDNSIKFIDIVSHFEFPFSAGLSENGLYFVWGLCGKSVQKIVSKPKETKFKSFNEVFAHYFQITYN